jgi:hypothetical protein
MPAYYQTASLSTFKDAGYNGFLNRGSAVSADSLVDAVRYESQHANLGRFSNPYLPVPAGSGGPAQHFHITGNEAPRDPYRPGVTDPTAQFLWHGPSQNGFFPFVNQTALPYDRGCRACQHRFQLDARTQQRDREDTLFYLIFGLLALQILLLIKK